jgi:hypothetical protein
MTKGIIESYLDESHLQKRVPEYIRIFMGADALTASLYDDENQLSFSSSTSLRADALTASLYDDENSALYRPQRDFIMIEPRESSVFLQNEETHSTPSFYEIEKSAGTKLIEMDSQGDITAVPGEEKKIATFGLSGCTAVAVVSEFPDGTKRGYIQHYSPLGDQLSGLVLRREMGGVEQQSPVSCKMVIMTPGEHCKDPDGKWIMMPRSQERVDNLIVESGINNDKDIKVYPYNLDCDLDSYGQGTLMIKFDYDGETTIYTEMLPVKFDEEL